MKSIFAYVKETRDNYRTDTIEVTDGYDFSQYETLRTIELYHNSRFTSGKRAHAFISTDGRIRMNRL